MATSDYLEQELDFYDDRIEVRGSGVQVMMAWERPLMERMAAIAGARRGDVLEVGFGMGLSCDAVQALQPRVRSHTIIEAHPQIIERARLWADGRTNATIVEGRWQDVLPARAFDGVSFDVFGGLEQRLAFFSRLGEILRPGGVATLWLGDDRELPEPLAATLRAQGFGWRMTRVSAVPDRRCTYSRSNEFYVPVIARA